MVMSPYHPYGLAISIAIFGAAIAYAARDAKRTGRFVGAAIASFQECLYLISRKLCGGMPASERRSA